MKAVITIDFEKIQGSRVDNILVSLVPQLRKSTDKTVSILCEQIKKYFKDHKIEVKISHTIKK